MSENSTSKRSAILARLIRTIICFIGYEVAEIALLLMVLFQYGHLIILGRRNDHVRKLSNRLAWYSYRVMRYATLNENARPFPFSPLPQDADIEPPSRSVRFD